LLPFMTPIYLDHNATTPLLPAAWEAMQPYYFLRFGNPASSHAFGRHARKGLEDARERIAALLDAQPDEVLFTSGATEANNLAIFGLVGPSPGSIASSAIEHPSVVEPIRQLLGKGYTRCDLPVPVDGCIDPDAAVFGADIRLAAVMLANHETGAIQPVEALVRRLGGRAPFHCDAAAAAGKMPISFRKLGVTSLTISGHKFHGPLGIGALLVRRNARLHPLLFGGHQQNSKRPGTESAALAVGMATALEWSLRNLDAHRTQLLELRRRFLDHLHQHAGPVLVNGSLSLPSPLGRGVGGERETLPHALNLSFPGCNADALLMTLDLAGVACSTGSACSSGSLLPSPVLAAMGKTGAALHSAMRFSFSPFQNIAEIEEAAQRIAHCVRKLRLLGDAKNDS
jgi:cysteine desulfurase